MERRQALHRQGRRLHLQPHEEVSGAGQGRASGTTTFGAPATTVTAEGNKVVFVFSGNAAPKYDGIIATKILPEHVYSTVGDPTKYIDKKPVSTGPFKVGSYNGRQLVLERRPDYWQADKIKVAEARPRGPVRRRRRPRSSCARASSTPTSGEIPNPEKTFVSADPENNHFYYAPNGMTVLTGNLTKAPFNDAKFREAISYAMNKEEMSLKATYGVMKPASQTGLKLPGDGEAAARRKYAGQDTVLPYDLAQGQPAARRGRLQEGRRRQAHQPRRLAARGRLLRAGRLDRLPGHRRRRRQGSERPGGQRQGHSLGPDSVDGQKKTGEFQLMLEYLHGGCELARNSAPSSRARRSRRKTEVLPNVQRFKDPAVDAAVTKLAGATDPREPEAADLGRWSTR